MELASLTVKIDVDLSGLRTQLDQVQKALDPLNKNMKEFAASTKSVTIAANVSADAVKRVSDRNRDANGTTANLGRALRELTTQYLGNNVAAIALGTALGNLATQAVSRLILAIIDSITQFARFQNQLALIPNVMGDVGGALQTIVAVSQTSKRSLSELTESYASVMRAAQGTRVSVAEANKLFQEYEARLATVQQSTLSNSVARLLASFGDVVTRLDNALGIFGSSGIIFVLGKISDLFTKIASFLPTINKSSEEWNDQLMKAREDARVFEDRLKHIQQNSSAYESTLRDIVRARQNEKEALENINRLLRVAQTLTTEQEIKRTDFIRDQAQAMRDQIGIARATREQQEILNKAIQFQNQLRQMGQEASNEELQNFIRLATQAQAASQFQSIRESLLTVEETEQESYSRRIEALRVFYDTQEGLTDERNMIISRAFFNHEVRMQEIQMQGAQNLIQQQNRTFSALGNVFQILGQKSKAAAVIALVINTALAVRQAIQNTAVASTRALAELGPIAGPPAAAAIKAWGAAEVALIIGAGALQGAATLGGGAPNTGGGGSTALEPSEEGTAPTRLVIEGVDPAAIFTGKQLNDLIEKINEEAANGSLVIANKLI